MKTYAEFFICDDCEKEYPLNEQIATCPGCGGLLETRYSLPSMKRDNVPLAWDEKDQSIWRYRRFFPHVDEANIISLGEGRTPLTPSVHIGKKYGLSRLFFKNDTMMPTGSFKDRGMSLAVSYGLQIGVKNAFTYSSGNAGASFAAYSSRAGLNSLVCVEYIANESKRAMIQLYGARTAILHFDSFDEIEAMLKGAAAELGVYQFVNFVNPLRHEAQKSLAYEICEDLGAAPDIMIQPIGTGGGLWGAFKGFNELAELGFTDHVPRMFCAQPQSCAHFKEAFDMGLAEAGPFGDATKTIAQSIACDAPLHKGRRALKALYDTNGAAMAVSDDEILEAMRDLAAEGIAAEPSAAAALAVFKQAAAQGLMSSDQTIVCVITGSGLKQPRAVEMAAGLPKITMRASVAELKRVLEECL